MFNYSIIAISIVIIYLVLFHFIKKKIHNKALEVSVHAQEDFYKKHPSAKEYMDDEYDWNPKFHLEHHALKVFNIPFVPEDSEVFYMENEYDKEANLFIQENLELIREVFATKGLTFVYLPSIRVSKDMAKSMAAYYTANPDYNISDVDLEAGLKNDFLLDYMVYPDNRPKVSQGFCWYNTASYLFNFKKTWHTFDYISFDGAEARQHPREILLDMLPELGNRKIWRKGRHCEVEIESEGLADEAFTEETKNILLEIQEKLNQIRLKGISEAVISHYIKPCPRLSRITISKDFRIILNEYNNTEITMQPIVKTVFILFLRHDEGIHFKDLPDYQQELEIIYRAIKAKKNNIDSVISSGVKLQISNNIKNLTNPFDNSINEKCTRIKEAFIIHFHESIASNYYIQGIKASRKVITIPRNLVVWEEES